MCIILDLEVTINSLIILATVCLKHFWLKSWCPVNLPFNIFFSFCLQSVANFISYHERNVFHPKSNVCDFILHMLLQCNSLRLITSLLTRMPIEITRFFFYQYIYIYMCVRCVHNDYQVYM